MSSRRNVGRIAGYVTEVATRKTDKKTSKNGGLFIASCLRLIIFTIMGISFLYGVYFVTKIYAGHLFNRKPSKDWPEKYTQQYRFLTYSSDISDKASKQMVFKVFGNGILLLPPLYEGAIEECPTPLIIQLQKKYPTVFSHKLRNKDLVISAS